MVLAARPKRRVAARKDATARGTEPDTLRRLVRDLAARLRAVQDLSSRLSGLHDLQGIGEAIIDEARKLIAFETIRVYRIDQVTGACEPIAFEGTFHGAPEPTPDQLRVPIGRGLTGWVAEHGEAIRVADAEADPRSVVVGEPQGPESMLVVPMLYEGGPRGLIVLSQVGRDAFSEDDLTTLTIFAGAAAQALVNAERLDQLHSQQLELEHQIDSQRRLLAVNERLLSTLDPAGVLDLIADSLKTVVAYDSLTIYRIDNERGVRKPVIARDRFAELILGYEAPVGTGLSGWVVDHREAVLANDAHLDPRSVQIPGTPFEPESMVVVPLLADGEVLGTLNVGRMGGPEIHYSQKEFELTKLFAAQAAIALHNAEAHSVVKVQAERDALTSLRNHGSFQRELQDQLGAPDGHPVALLMMDLDRFKSYNDRRGHPAGDELLATASRAIEASIRQVDRAYRYGGDEFAVILPDCGRTVAEEVALRIRGAIAAIPDDSEGPRVAISIGVACFPEDALQKDALVEVADQALFLAKGAPFRLNARDQFVAALDETAMSLLDGSEPGRLLDSILVRAARLVGVPHGYVYLLEAGDTSLVCRAAIGDMVEFLGFHLPLDRGVAGTVYRTGRPFALNDYATFDKRASEFVGAVVGVPLAVGGRVVGVLGLASGSRSRVFRPQEIDALARFAQLASIALENERLHEQARSPRDPVTGLPSRETFLRRIADAMGAPVPRKRAKPAAAGGRKVAPAKGRTGRRASTAKVGGAMAVLLLDIDRFTIVNESLGPAIGDLLLRGVGERISGVIGHDDIVSRFGGDEFAILLESTDAEMARALGHRIVAELKAPFDLDGRVWFISGSVGIGIGLPGMTEPLNLVREAGIALVSAKANPTSRVELFDPIRGRFAIERVKIETELRGALERDELMAYYQPIIDLATEGIVGFEALARWQHPDRGLVLPVDFIGLAEESDLIVPLGNSMLEKACTQAQAWRKRWPDEDLVMSVNLSPRQFADPGLAPAIDSVLRRTGLDPRALELEITEGSVMDRSAAGLGVLEDLRALGVRIVLDDFGMGYSSLAYLRQLPLDIIKIDQSFVTELDSRDPNVGIVRAVVSLARGLGVKVVAEGIETPEQARRLRVLGCDMGQGYRWARPTDAAGIETLVEGRLARRRPPLGSVRRSRAAARLISAV